MSELTPLYDDISGKIKFGRFLMTLAIMYFRSNYTFLKDYRPVHAVMFGVEKEEGNNKRNPLYNMECKVITMQK